jgi:hypothetical protein
VQQEDITVMTSRTTTQRPHGTATTSKQAGQCRGVEMWISLLILRGVRGLGVRNLDTVD